MKDVPPGEFRLSDTGCGEILRLIHGKYKLPILYILGRYDVLRFNEIQRIVTGISYKTLSANLKELEADALVERRVYPQTPPKVEYRLTPRGTELYPILEQLCRWGRQHLPAEREGAAE